MKFLYKIFGIAVFFLILNSCQVTSPSKILKHAIAEKTQALHHHMGVQVLDLASHKNLFTYQSEALFVPASNNKIFTLASAVKHLPDSMVAFQYQIKNPDEICIKGTYDPSFLNPHFNNDKNLRFLTLFKSITIDSTQTIEPKLGLGWAWEDYQEDYQTEICPMPMFGNLVRIKNNKNTISTLPLNFEKQTKISSQTKSPNRQVSSNDFMMPTKNMTIEIPFVWSYQVAREILQSVTQNEVKLGACEKSAMIPYFNTPRDTVLRKMMFDSDNTIAEQIVLQCTNANNTSKACAILKAEQLGDIPTKWVDGSGLSRYNLSSPKAINHVLQNMVDSLGFEKAISYFAKNKISSQNQNIVAWSKSGSMGGIYNQSGYLISKKGKKLAFSVLSNNSTESVLAIKKASLSIIEKIYNTY